ncbi:MAG: hypothetical protein A2020_08945 [Lentisphaerae bacterium GWF2_45_14]|nr:MAG: hypothetical protein A2020_08945 [Lentisphaerae bacterium GWF2_45_14]
MKIVLQSWGSNGDIRPVMALAGGLKAAGNKVVLLATCVDSTDFSTLASASGVEYLKVPESVELDIPDFLKKTSSQGNLPSDNIRFVRLLMETLFFPYQEIMFEEALRQCSDADLAIGHVLCYPLRAAAEIRKIPYLSICFWPGLVPSSQYIQPGMPDFGRFINLAGWKIIYAVLNILLKRKIRKFWTSKGLAPFRNVHEDVFLSKELNLVAASPVLFQPPPDWGKRHRMSGFLNISDAAENLTTPRDLSDFISSGESPVFLGLGSMQMIQPEYCTELLISAARKSGLRAIINTNSGKFPPGLYGKNIFLAGQVPHHRIFPRCRAVLHHGGAGTTHTASMAGCPSVTIPFIDEQLSWGRILHSLGIGTKPLPFVRATPDKIARLLHIATESDEMLKRAAVIGSDMRNHDGVAETVKIITNFLRK